jgi:hypothetical protein
LIVTVELTGVIVLEGIACLTRLAGRIIEADFTTGQSIITDGAGTIVIVVAGVTDGTDVGAAGAGITVLVIANALTGIISLKSEALLTSKAGIVILTGLTVVKYSIITTGEGNGRGVGVV